MTRSTKLPDFSRLPAAKKKALPPYNGEAVPERSPKLRLLCIHGAADSDLALDEQNDHVRWASGLDSRIVSPDGAGCTIRSQWFSLAASTRAQFW